MFVHKRVTSNYTINLSSSMGTFLMKQKYVVEFLALLFSSLTYAFRMLVMYLLKSYNGKPLYETIICLGTPGLRTFG